MMFSSNKLLHKYFIINIITMGYSKYQGKVRLLNEHKYLGDPNNVVFRSSWELFFSKFLDSNNNVVKWASEEFFIPYFNPLDGKEHRYFPDYFVSFKNGKKIVVEVKPHKETIEPDIKKIKNKKTAQASIETYIKNCAKWEAAKKYCDDRNMKFLIFTEHELKQLKK